MNREGIFRIYRKIGQDFRSIPLFGMGQLALQYCKLYLDGYEATEVIKQNLGHFPAIAVIFKRKMKEFSKQGHNFLTATGGKNSVWYIPSYWAWNIREYKLYNRTVKILYTQLNRGIKTKVLLPSGVSLEETIKYGTVIEAALRDTTSWICPKCKARNIAENDKCAICKTEKPTIKAKQGKSKKSKKT